MPCLEERNLQVSRQLSRDVACHLLARFSFGLTVVVSDKPKVFVSPLRKNWLYLGRKILRSRTSTLDLVKIDLFSSKFTDMQTVPFRTTDYAINKGVLITDIKKALACNNIANLYICCKLTPVQEKLILTHVAPCGLVVKYTIKEKL